MCFPSLHLLSLGRHFVRRRDLGQPREVLDPTSSQEKTGAPHRGPRSLLATEEAEPGLQSGRRHWASWGARHRQGLFTTQEGPRLACSPPPGPDVCRGSPESQQAVLVQVVQEPGVEDQGLSSTSKLSTAEEAQAKLGVKVPTKQTP
ncbi:uncharacterized protein LOC144581181 [Callithrix jacchus]